MAEDKNKTVVVKPLAKAFLTTKPEDNESPVDRPVQRKTAVKPQKAVPKASEVAKKAAALEELKEPAVESALKEKQTAVDHKENNLTEGSKVKKTETPAKDAESAKEEKKAATSKKPEVKVEKAEQVEKKETVKKAETKPAAKAEKAEPAKKPAAKTEKAEPAKKPAVKAEKTEPAKKPAAKAEKAEPAKKTAVKPVAKTEELKTAVKKAEAKQSIIIQYQNDSYNQAELVATAEKIWTKDMKKKASDLKSLELYIKPQEKMVYCVYNKKVTHSFAI